MKKKIWGEYWLAAHSICNLKYSVSKQIPIVFHFIIKELEEKFKKQFSCLGKNTKKYITFTVPIEKEVTIIDARFMASIINLFEGVLKIKYKYGYEDQKCKTLKVI